MKSGVCGCGGEKSRGPIQLSARAPHERAVLDAIVRFWMGEISAEEAGTIIGGKAQENIIERIWEAKLTRGSRDLDRYVLIMDADLVVARYARERPRWWQFWKRLGGPSFRRRMKDIEQGPASAPDDDLAHSIVRYWTGENRSVAKKLAGRNDRCLALVETLYELKTIHRADGSVQTTFGTLPRTVRKLRPTSTPADYALASAILRLYPASDVS